MSKKLADLAFSGVHEKEFAGKILAMQTVPRLAVFIGNKVSAVRRYCADLGFGRGEAVLNWGQKVVEPAMRAYYGIGLAKCSEEQRTPLWLWGRPTQPMYARGGYSNVRLATQREAAADLAQRMFAKGFNVTDANRPGRTGSSYHNSGNALDFGDSGKRFAKSVGCTFSAKEQVCRTIWPFQHFAVVCMGSQQR